MFSMRMMPGFHHHIFTRVSAISAQKITTVLMQLHSKVAAPSRHVCCRMMSKLMRALTELRQACCHPQIVRRQDALLGQQRLSMDQILARLTTQAFSHYDNAIRAWVLARVIHIAVCAHFTKQLGEICTAPFSRHCVGQDMSANFIKQGLHWILATFC